MAILVFRLTTNSSLAELVGLQNCRSLPTNHFRIPHRSRKPRGSQVCFAPEIRGEISVSCILDDRQPSHFPDSRQIQQALARYCCSHSTRRPRLSGRLSC